MTEIRTEPIAEWIAAEGLSGASETELLQGFCARLRAAGIALNRAYVGIDALHPVLQGRGFEWWHDSDEADQQDYSRGNSDQAEARWLQSPFYVLFETGTTKLRRRLDDGYRRGEFPMLDDLLAAGSTDYLALLVHLGEPAAVGEMDSIYSSWSTDRPGGFSAAETDALERLFASFALAVKGAAVTWTANTLMETYLGRGAGRRVLRCQIERGQATTLRTVLWYSDLEGFTRIADTIARDQLIPLLNDYAACLVQAVHAHDGQVLKFMGDGLLAIFEIDEQADATGACRRALDAAAAALAEVGRLSRRREAAGLPVTRFYLALHLGEVLYGNIGSDDRLDFTVVGPAVNEASRISAMCRSLDRDIIVSSAFAEAAEESRDRLVSLGRYALRGVKRPQELFTTDPGDSLES